MRCVLARVIHSSRVLRKVLQVALSRDDASCLVWREGERGREREREGEGERESNNVLLQSIGLMLRRFSSSRTTAIESTQIYLRAGREGGGRNVLARWVCAGGDVMARRVAAGSDVADGCGRVLERVHLLHQEVTVEAQLRHLSPQTVCPFCQL